ncbi:inner membrane protein [Hathewaya proteolytica DSM 3090]|uniref:Inner membrane protein n=1 Tax=Hathewaya proteolytica DSM 3090 TaxID=1121331 RepID=A0A1M6NG55_9CLOT|nr:metal-dependent hydrolase [Hathewaya proteolytica]SHJ94715.1 inner membrane protein [Hathewaya proteolytica DSM 3090]
MQGKTHAALGVAAYMIVSDVLHSEFSAAGFVAAVVSSLMADIDHPKSLINKYILPIKSERVKRVFYAVSGMLILYADYAHFNLLLLKVIGVTLILISLNSHRNGLSHSIAGFVATIVMGILLEKACNVRYLALYIGGGYFTHILGDSFTKNGVPLLYPMSKKKVRMPIYYTVGSYTGNMVENIIFTATLSMFIIKLFILN